MIVGAKDKLAFEFEITRSQGAMTLGRFCMWARDQTIGNFSDTQIMGVIQEQMKIALECREERMNSELFTAQKDHAFNIIHNALYNAEGNSDAIEALSIKYSPFSITDLGAESFDNLFVYLICSTSGERLLWRHVEETSVKEAMLAPNTFEVTVHDYLHVYSAVEGTYT